MQHERTPQQRLARSVEKLTRAYTVEHVQRVPGGGRRLVHTQHDPLIVMLRAASLSSGGAHSGSGAQSRSVVDDDALTKMQQLRKTIHDLWSELVPGTRVPRRQVPHEQALIAWHELFVTHCRLDLVAPEQVAHADVELSWWVRTIEMKFDPARTIELTLPCPRCGERWATSGEGVLEARISALSLSFAGSISSATAVCRNCGMSWRGEHELRELEREQRTTRAIMGDSLT